MVDFLIGGGGTLLTPSGGGILDAKVRCLLFSALALFVTLFICRPVLHVEKGNYASFSF